MLKAKLVFNNLWINTIFLTVLSLIKEIRLFTPFSGILQSLLFIGIAIGIIQIAYQFSINRFSSKYYIILLFFIATLFISTLFSTSNLSSNVKETLITSILILGSFVEINNHSSTKKLRISRYLTNIVLITTVIFSILSIVTFYAKFDFSKAINILGYEIQLGVFGNRLFGVYSSVTLPIVGLALVMSFVQITNPLSDDTYITKHMEINDFFSYEVPRDIVALDSLAAVDQFTDMIFNNIKIINKHFNKKISMRNNLKKWFNISYGIELYRTTVLYPWHNFLGFYNHHLPLAYNKKTFFEVWEKEFSTLDLTCLEKFRHSNNVTGWLIRYWRIAKGEFFPMKRSTGHYFEIKNELDADKVGTIIEKSKYKMVCINDTDELINSSFDVAKMKINDSFNKLLPEKSTFEI